MTEPVHNGERQPERRRRGWFSDPCDEEDAVAGYRWQPYLETGTGFIPPIQVWFATKEACDEFIATEVIGVGWLPGEGKQQ